MSNNIDSILYKNYTDYGLEVSYNNLSNFFEVIPFPEGPMFNLHKVLTIANTDMIPINYFVEHTIEEGDMLPIISYKYYNTIDLWWIICKFNNITDPFEPLIGGQVLKIPTSDIVKQILKAIKEN